MIPHMPSVTATIGTIQLQRLTNWGSILKYNSGLAFSAIRIDTNVIAFSNGSLFFPDHTITKETNIGYFPATHFTPRTPLEISLSMAG